MNQRTPAVSVRNVTKRFGPVLANDKVCLDVHRGEILALLGENGSGKTTLMNMLSGIYFPDEGEIFINGKPLSRYWSKGPQLSAYLPAPMLNQGVNELIILELEGFKKDVETLVLAYEAEEKYVLLSMSDSKTALCFQAVEFCTEVRVEGMLYYCEP